MFEIENLGHSKTKKNKNGILYFGIFILAIAALIFILNYKDRNKIIEVVKSEYYISSSSLDKFDLYFLKGEGENKIYSPLSIKYALSMLKDGTDGNSKAQILGVIGDYQAKKYVNSKNMSFANALFVKDTYDKSIEKNYRNELEQKYSAEIIVDSFRNPNVVNYWVNNKTLGLINNLYDDVSNAKFLLVNALAIDMEWEDKFIKYDYTVEYSHEEFYWHTDACIYKSEFEDVKDSTSGMAITASFNNYDIVNVLGEENIRKTVKTEFEKYLAEHGITLSDYFRNWNGYSDLTEEEMMDKYLNNYIKEIDSNYKREDKVTDFSFYINDDVKVFAKDLKEYNGTTLQYIGIMPIKEDLESYTNDISVNDINNLIGNLKELKIENFKDGVVTKINGYIPKFKFEYSFDLTEEFKKIGITDIFDSNKANLSKISYNKNLYINDIVHKANIEFTQDGIKAAAATGFGSGAGGDGFDYIYDVPVEEIDMNFNKPYMFIIRDKESNEVWFAGSVYEPLLYSEDTTAYDSLK